MKDRMHRRRRRKLQLVGDVADLVDDLLWAEELEAQLLMGARGQRRLDIRLKTQIDEVADIERALEASLVSMGLHALLGTQQVLANSSQHGLALGDHGGNIWHRRSSFISQTEMTRRMPIEYLKWGTAQCGMEICVVPKLRKRKPLQPLAGTRVNKAPQVGLQTLINAFGLAVRLRMVC